MLFRFSTFTTSFSFNLLAFTFRNFHITFDAGNSFRYALSINCI